MTKLRDDISKKFAILRGKDRGCHRLCCVAVCCSVLQCVAVIATQVRPEQGFCGWRLWSPADGHMCCSVVCCNVLQCFVLQCVAVCCNVLQCVAVCCSVLQCVAVCCPSAKARCGAVCEAYKWSHFRWPEDRDVFNCTISKLRRDKVEANADLDWVPLNPLIQKNVTWQLVFELKVIWLTSGLSRLSLAVSFHRKNTLDEERLSDFENHLWYWMPTKGQLIHSTQL